MSSYQFLTTAIVSISEKISARVRTLPVTLGNTVHSFFLLSLDASSSLPVV